MRMPAISMRSARSSCEGDDVEQEPPEEFKKSMPLEASH